MVQENIGVSRFPASVTGHKSNVGQGQLDLKIDCQAEVRGIGMGVLNDGTPFLTQRGLATLCGVENAHIGTIGTQWDEDVQKPRISKIRDLISARGELPSKPFFEIADGSKRMFAYPEAVCSAVLEYYAFDAGINCQGEALANFRKLAGRALREFIYATVGYDPNKNVADEWKPFHDRVSLTYNAAPEGYFSIFRESAEIAVTMGHAGIHPNSSVIPDISIGLAWGSFWSERGLAGQYGERRQYRHNYPAYFPQAASNPQHPWCYPDAALPAFRKWLRGEYISAGRFSSYVQSQVKRGQLPASTAHAALSHYGQAISAAAG